MKPGYLFASKDLRTEMESRLREVAVQVERWEVELILRTSTPDLVAALVEEYGAEPLVLHEDCMEQLPVEETKIDVSNDRNRAIFDRPRPCMMPGSIIKVVIPFDGHPALLTMRPSQHFMGTSPMGRIDGSEIVLTHTAIDPTTEQIRGFVDKQLGLIRQLVSWVNADLVTFVGQLPAHAEGLVEQRRARLQKDRGLEGALGIPVRRRDDAPRPVPIVRKRLGLQRVRHQIAAAKSYQDEYAIDQDQYAEVVDIILGMGRAFERSPTTFAKLEEDRLRDHILVQLNGTFEGHAGGELFNGEGKTDTLVRVEDRNIFIGECKIWHGEKRFTDAIDQLLRYLVWRDTKAALVLFIRRHTRPPSSTRRRTLSVNAPTLSASGGPQWTERSAAILCCSKRATLRGRSRSPCSQLCCGYPRPDQGAALNFACLPHHDAAGEPVHVARAFGVGVPENR